MDERTVRGKATASPAVPRQRGEQHSIQSVDRAITLLEAIAEAGGETTLTELSRRTRLNISSPTLPEATSRSAMTVGLSR